MKQLSQTIIALLIVLVPSVSGAEQLVPCEGLDCNYCHIVEIVNRIVQWVMIISTLIVVLVLAVAGWRLITSGGDSSAYEGAKKLFYNAVIGVVILLAAWTMIDTMVKILMKEEFQPIAFGPWNSLECGGMTNQQSEPLTPLERVALETKNSYDLIEMGFTPRTCSPGAEASAGSCEAWCATQGPNSVLRSGSSLGITGEQGGRTFCVTPPAELPPIAPDPNPGGGLTQAEAEARLGSAFITVVSSGGCTNKSQRNCTSLEGVKSGTLDRIIQLQRDVGVPIVITGGTEAGHAQGQYSHENGYKIDLRVDPVLNNYIMTNYTSMGGNRWRDPKGNVFYRHGPDDHWDVKVTNP